MSRARHFSALLLPLLAFFPTFNAWEFSQTNVDLSSPPPINSGDSVVNGEVLTNYSTSRTAWPCYDYPVPQEVARTPFPIYGGQLSFTLTNVSAGSLANYQYIGDAYFGQISLGDGTYSVAAEDNVNVGFSYIDTYAWYDFSTGQDCSDPIDVAAKVAEALGKGTGDMRESDLVGMNATVGLRIVLVGSNLQSPFRQLDDQPVEEMYQCGYVYFTDEDLSNDPNAGYCNGGASPTSGSGAAPTTLVTSSIPTPTSSITIPNASGNFTAVAASGSHTNTVAVGTGVGVSMGASLLILIVAFIFVRRRKARKHLETIGADIIVTRPQDANEAKGAKGEKGVESSGSSTHSEQLPPYTSVKEVPKEDSESDVT